MEQSSGQQSIIYRFPKLLSKRVIATPSRMLLTSRHFLSASEHLQASLLTLITFLSNLSLTVSTMEYLNYHECARSIPTENVKSILLQCSTIRSLRYVSSLRSKMYGIITTKYSPLGTSSLTSHPTTQLGRPPRPAMRCYLHFQALIQCSRGPEALSVCHSSCSFMSLHLDRSCSRRFLPMCRTLPR